MFHHINKIFYVSLVLVNNTAADDSKLLVVITTQYVFKLREFLDVPALNRFDALNRAQRNAETSQLSQSETAESEPSLNENKTCRLVRDMVRKKLSFQEGHSEGHFNMLSGIWPP